MKKESLFDTSARNFAAETDALIADKRYRRGEVFVEAVKKEVPYAGEVLDYGCGPGRLARLLAQEGYRVHGLDPSTGMLDVARSQDIARLSVIFEQLHDNGENLAGARYDAVVCSSTIEFVEDAPNLLRQFHRALKPNGALVISYANRHSLWRKYSELRFRNTAPHLKLQHHVWSAGEFKHILETTGFQLRSNPVFFEAAPFDKRSWLRPLSSWPMIGILGLVVAKRRD